MTPPDERRKTIEKRSSPGTCNPLALSFGSVDDGHESPDQNTSAVKHDGRQCGTIG